MLAEHDLFFGFGFHPSKRPHSLFTILDIDAVSCAQRSDRQTRYFLSGCLDNQKHGGDGRDRTDDLMLAKQLLSQLSYVP